MTTFILELAKHVAKDVSVHGLKFAARLGYDRLTGRIRRQKAAYRFGIELTLWHEYLNAERARLERVAEGTSEIQAPVVGTPPPRILFTDADSVQALGKDLDEDGRAALTLAYFCMAEMVALASDAQLERAPAEIRARIGEWRLRVDRLCGYFDRALGLLTPPDFVKQPVAGTLTA